MKYVLLRALCACLFATAATASTQGAPPSGVLFENVRIFDGRSERLSPPAHVLRSV